MNPELNKISKLHAVTAQFIDEFDEQQTAMHAAKLLSPLLQDTPEPSSLIFDPIQDLFTNDALWRSFIGKLDPTNATEAAPKNTFHFFSETDETEVEQKEDEEKAPELDEQPRDFTAGDSIWREKNTTWQWSRQPIDYKALEKIEFIECDGIAERLYNIFCVELGNQPCPQNH